MEDAILGAILNEGQGRYEGVLDILQDKECFYSPKNAALWGLMKKMILKGIPVDLLSLAHECLSDKETSEFWTPFALTKLSNSITTTAHVDSYCYKLVEKYKARELIRVCGDTINAAYEDDIFDVLQHVEDGVFELTMGSTKSEYRSSSTVANETLAALINQINNPKEFNGIDTGLKSLNVITGGWQNSDLIILGAPSGLGKTAFALNLALAAAKSGKGVGFFTMEMKDTQLMNRLYSMDSLVPLDFIKKANLSNSQLEQVVAASNSIARLPLYIDQEPNISVFELRAKARKMKSKHGIGIIFVDYLQLMKGEGNNRELEVASISRGLKGLAKSLDIPIVALSQLNSNGEVRESKAIEHDANILMVLKRSDYKKSEGEIDHSLANTAELDIVKNRDGASGVSVLLNTDLSTQRFFDPTTDFQKFDNPNAGLNRPIPDATSFKFEQTEPF